MKTSFAFILVVLLTAHPSWAGPSLRDIIRAEDTRDVRTLTSFLKTSDGRLRARAARALGRIQDPNLIPLLVDLARHDPDARAEALFAIGQTESAEAQESLIGLLADAKTAQVRALIAIAVGKTAGPSGAALAKLFALLGDTDQGVRFAAATALEDFAWRNRRTEPCWEPSAADAIRVLPLLEATESPRLRFAAAGVLWRFAWKPPHPRQHSPSTRKPPEWLDAVRIPLTARLHDEDPDVRMRALQALGEACAPEALPSDVGHALNDKDWRVRVAAIEAVARAAPDRAWPLLLEQQLNDAQPLVVLASLRAMETLAHRHHKSSPGRGVYGVVVNTAMPIQVRAEALRIAFVFQEFAGRQAPQPLGPAGPPVTHPNTTHPLTTIGAWSNEWRVRQALAEGSAQLLTAETADAETVVLSSQYQAVVRPFLHDADARVRAAAAEAVGGVMVAAVDRKADTLLDAVRADLLEALADKDMVVRAVAANALADQGVREAVPPVLDTLRQLQSDNNVEVTTSLIEVLGRLKDPRAVPLLQRLVDDADANVSRAAAAGVGVITGSPSPRGDHPHTRVPVPVDALDFIERVGSKPVRAVLHTTRGDLTLGLFVEEAPLTVWNFVSLARKKYFDGLTFHRVVPNFVVQGGDPRGDGWGGPGYTIRCEYNPLTYGRGAVGMALAGKDTGGSQFFITHSPQPRLNGRYTLFGQLEGGDEVLDRITEGDVIRSVELIGD